MSVVPRKDSKGRTTYWAVYRFNKRQIWERVGRDKREAQRIEEKRRNEIKAGKFRPTATARSSVKGYVDSWCASRTTRNKDREEALLDRYVSTKEIGDLQMRHVDTGAVMDWLAELKTTISENTGERISSKHVANIYGVLRTMFRYALRHGDIEIDPFSGMDAKAVDRSVTKKRRPYTAADARALMGRRVQVERRMWNAFALLTGMRCGEVCGRRFRDWDRTAQPFGSLDVSTQWNDQPMKTKTTRIVPVHPELARLLTWWWETGFEFVHCRKPTLNDFIVPRRGDEGRHPHTPSTAYKQWLVSCREAGVTNLSVHSTRHTFISMCRRGGARKEILEKVTHNAKGDIVDQYTHTDWEPLCEAVSMLTGPLIANESSGFSSAGGGSRTLTSSGDSGPLKRIARVSSGGSSLVEFPEIPEHAALCCASQHLGPIADQRAAEDELDAAATSLEIAGAR